MSRDENIEILKLLQNYMTQDELDKMSDKELNKELEDYDSTFRTENKKLKIENVKIKKEFLINNGKENFYFNEQAIWSEDENGKGGGTHFNLKKFLGMTQDELSKEIEINGTKNMIKPLIKYLKDEKLIKNRNEER